MYHYRLELKPSFLGAKSVMTYTVYMHLSFPLHSYRARLVRNLDKVKKTGIMSNFAKKVWGLSPPPSHSPPGSIAYACALF